MKFLKNTIFIIICLLALYGAWSLYQNNTQRNKGDIIPVNFLNNNHINRSKSIFEEYEKFFNKQFDSFFQDDIFSDKEDLFSFPDKFRELNQFNLSKPEINFETKDDELIIHIKGEESLIQNIEIKLDNNMLVLKNKESSEEEKENNNYQYNKKRIRNFKQQVSLPVKVDSSKMDIEVDNNYIIINAPIKDSKTNSGNRIKI
ncbi:MAG: Hsp20 family protein [Candidatus Muiribacteriota bacterium]